jgi:hypothetical protein
MLQDLLVNHRTMLEVALLEKQAEEMRQLLASERSVPLLTMRTPDGQLVASQAGSRALPPDRDKP